MGVAIKLEAWGKLAVDERRTMMLDFYATDSHKLRDNFLSFVEAPKGYGVFASAGPNYQHAVFGRDSLEVAEDLLESHPDLARNVIMAVASLQGQQFTEASEEEPGKIHHEYRSLIWNDRPAKPAAQKVFDRLKTNWGGTDTEIRYYGSYDASALFVRLVHRYCELHGNEILHHTVNGYNLTKLPLRDHVRQAALWIAGRVAASPWHLFEFKRLNPKGTAHQAWEDSDLAYIHADGTVANADTGVAAIELQGYAYDALRGAADLVAVSDAEAAAWRTLAATLQAQTLKELWMEDHQFFAMGLDRGPQLQTRQIKTLNCNAGLLLDSNLLLDLPDNHRARYVDGLVRTLWSDEFLVPTGLRLRAKRHQKLVSFADYHGCEVSWPKQTYDIAKGLRRHNMIHLAEFLESCILASVARAGEFYEFFFVTNRGGVKYHYRLENPDEPTFHDFGAANLPDPGQAWTISAVLAIVAARHRRKHIQRPAINEKEKRLLTLAEIKAIRDSLTLPPKMIRPTLS
jgi:glycogen debranching enzyme